MMKDVIVSISDKLGTRNFYPKWSALVKLSIFLCQLSSPGGFPRKTLSQVKPPEQNVLPGDGMVYAKSHHLNGDGDINGYIANDSLVGW